MNVVVRLLGLLVTLVVLSMPVRAADLFGPAPAPAETKSSYDWSGAYVGVSAGYARGSSQAKEVNMINDPANPAYCNNNGDGTYTCNINGQPHPISSPMSSFNMIGDTWSAPLRGTIAGVTAGYNLQNGNIVYGFEVDYSFANMKGQAGPSPWSVDDTFLHTRATDTATARLRAGYAFDRLLLFATAGAASAHFNSYVDDPDMNIGIRTTPTPMQWGYALGLGAEYAFTDHLTVKADWLTLMFPGTTSSGYVNVSCVGGCPPQWKLDRAGMAGEGTFGWSIKHSLNLFRVGLNYKF